jgi:hypothetical protein
MTQKRVLKARDLINDIRGGMGDAELMKKYHLSSLGLQSAFDKLIEAGAIQLQEIYGRSPEDDNTVGLEGLRELPRHYLAVVVPIFEPTRPEIRGTLRDITEQGIGVRGIEARIGEIKSLVIPCGKYLKTEHIWFEAECIWAGKRKPGGETAGGFQITKISETDLDNLRQMIRLLSLNG